MTTVAQKFCIWYSKLKNIIEAVAATHFVMQKLFIVQKEKHFHTEHGLDVLYYVVTQNNRIVLLFLTSIKVIVNFFFLYLRWTIKVTSP